MLFLTQIHDVALFALGLLPHNRIDVTFTPEIKARSDDFRLSGELSHRIALIEKLHVF